LNPSTHYPHTNGHRWVKGRRKSIEGDPYDPKVPRKKTAGSVWKALTDGESNWGDSDKGEERRTPSRAGGEVNKGTDWWIFKGESNSSQFIRSSSWPKKRRPDGDGWVQKNLELGRHQESRPEGLPIAPYTKSAEQKKKTRPRGENLYRRRQRVPWRLA